MSKDTKSEGSSKVDTELPEVEHELSQVATNPKQSMMILVGISAVFLYLFFNLFISSGDSDKEKDLTPVPDEVVQPVQVASDSNIPEIPTLPSPPKLEDPTPPPPPPSTAAFPLAEEALPALPIDAGIQLPAEPSLPFGAGPKDENAKKRQEAKRKSSIILVAGIPPKKSLEQIQEEADFRYRGDMHLVLGRGKMLDAIIETAVNTDFGGEIRAIIQRDVYSEWGKNILIQKGSRVYGNYATGVDGAYGRIAIEWTRLDLANGYTMNLSGSGMDSLGKKGVQGRVDNKFREKFSNAILRSAFNVVLANMLDSIVEPQISTQAAANQNQAASNIQNIANGIFTQAGITDVQKRLQICGSVLASIEDKTSTAFTQIQAACQAADANLGGQTGIQQLTTIMTSITTASVAFLQNTNSNVEETKAQEASKQAFTDISDTLKEMVEGQEFKPTITIDQGTPIKIYVNKDYKFPKAAIKQRVSR